MEVTEIWGLVE